ncbi:MAG: ATP-binding protein [Gemmatimonadota bacterium]|nr:ATP-binding protein [Gemmatimonadota bacterium]
MSLRLRIVFALVAIAAILVSPAAYGIGALRELQEIARELRTRDAVGALALGRVQAGLREAESQQRVYLVLASGEPDERAAVGAEVESAARAIDTNLARLEAAGYGAAAAPARRSWSTLRVALLQQQAWVEAGEIARADRYLTSTVEPAFAATNRALEPVAAELNRGGEAQVERAQEVASGAARTTLLALAAALIVALLIAGWLARTLLGPIGELRRGMASVAEGDFEPDVRIPTQRPDELGDLSRSFSAMTAQLAELDRLKAEFVSVASHELKTPLSVIRGYASLLQEGIYGPISEPQKKTLASIGDQTERLNRLIQRLLDISRFEAGGGRLEIRSIPLRPFLAEMADGFEVLAHQSQIDFAVEVDPSLPEQFRGDPDRLNEVLGNLLSNAFKFTPAEGRIRLRAGADSRTLLLEVEDTGVGIPPDMLPKIFEKFFQVENVAQPRSVGSGLGLAISQEIVQAHGGTITADSELGKGTIFRIALPIIGAAHPIGAPAGIASS